MTKILDWIKDAYNTVYNFFAENFLFFLLLVSFAIIVVFFIVARICTCGNYYARLSRKFKSLDKIIRENQINEDREKFLIKFNKVVKKKNKKFASAWNSYLVDDGQEASAIFKNTKFDHGKKGFFNFFLIFSWIVSLCATVLIMSFKKFDFKAAESMYIVILVPIFIIVLGCLFNLIYVSVRNKQRKDMLEHLDFFIANIDSAVKGFEKSDFELCGIKKTNNIKENDPNILSYDQYTKTEENAGLMSDELRESIDVNLAETQTQKALLKAIEVQKQNKGADIEQKAKDEERILQLENEEMIDESKEKLLNNLKKLKNLEILTEGIDKDHPHGDVDAEKKQEIENELTNLIDDKKEELNAQTKGKKLKVLDETPVGRKKLKKPQAKKESLIGAALVNLKQAKDNSNLTKVANENKEKTKKTKPEVKKVEAKKTAPAQKVEDKKPEIVKNETKAVKTEQAKITKIPAKAPAKKENAKVDVAAKTAEVKTEKTSKKTKPAITKKVKTSEVKAEENKPEVKPAKAENVKAEEKPKTSNKKVAKPVSEKKETLKVKADQPKTEVGTKKVEAKIETPNASESKLGAFIASSKNETVKDKELAKEKTEVLAKNKKTKKVVQSEAKRPAAKKTVKNAEDKQVKQEKVEAKKTDVKKETSKENSKKASTPSKKEEKPLAKKEELKPVKKVTEKKETENKEDSKAPKKTVKSKTVTAAKQPKKIASSKNNNLPKTTKNKK